MQFLFNLSYLLKYQNGNHDNVRNMVFTNGGMKKTGSDLCQAPLNIIKVYSNGKWLGFSFPNFWAVFLPNKPIESVRSGQSGTEKISHVNFENLHMNFFHFFSYIFFTEQFILHSTDLLIYNACRERRINASIFYWIIGNFNFCRLPVPSVFNHGILSFSA